jgi:hypothetical protein
VRAARRAAEEPGTAMMLSGTDGARRRQRRQLAEFIGERRAERAGASSRGIQDLGRSGTASRAEPVRRTFKQTRSSPG